jgi:RNA polymerase sigma factor (sigma-70 family)
LRDSAAPIFHQARQRVTFYRAQRMKRSGDLQRLKRSALRARLMERMQRGDGDACAALLDDIGPSLTRFLRRRIAEPQEVEDVYQEVLMAVFEARHTYELGRPLEPWLFAIARNIAIDHTRQRWSRARWEELVGDPPEREADVADISTSELDKVLGKLPPDQREAFSMLKLEALSVEAAATRAGISVVALKARAHRAYKSLKKMIGG